MVKKYQHAKFKLKKRIRCLKYQTRETIPINKLKLGLQFFPSFFFSKFVRRRCILWCDWYFCFELQMPFMAFKIKMNSSSSALFLSLVLSDPQSHLWLPGPGIEPASFTCEAPIFTETTQVVSLKNHGIQTIDVQSRVMGRGGGQGD